MAAAHRYAEAVLDAVKAGHDWAINQGHIDIVRSSQRLMKLLEDNPFTSPMQFARDTFQLDGWNPEEARAFLMMMHPDGEPDVFSDELAVALVETFEFEVLDSTPGLLPVQYLRTVGGVEPGGVAERVATAAIEFTQLVIDYDGFRSGVERAVLDKVRADFAEALGYPI